jgi:hypothetical protein
MRERSTTLVSGFSGTIHFFSSIILGAIHNVILLFALTVIGSSFIYGGYRNITKSQIFTSSNGTLTPQGFVMVNNTVLISPHQAVEDIHYQLFYHLFYILGFYHLEVDIYRREYTSSFFQHPLFWVTF